MNKSTKTASLEQLREMYERGEVKAPSSDAPKTEMPDDFWETAEPQPPKKGKD